MSGCGVVAPSRDVLLTGSGLLLRNVLVADSGLLICEGVGSDGVVLRWLGSGVLGGSDSWSSLMVDAEWGGDGGIPSIAIA